MRINRSVETFPCVTYVHEWMYGRMDEHIRAWPRILLLKNSRSIVLSNWYLDFLNNSPGSVEPLALLAWMDHKGLLEDGGLVSCSLGVGIPGVWRLMRMSLGTGLQSNNWAVYAVNNTSKRRCCISPFGTGLCPPAPPKRRCQMSLECD